MDINKLKSMIREIPDFPTKGVGFKDITPILLDSEAFQFTIKTMADLYQDTEVDLIVGPEARGFIYGATLAYEMNTGFVPIRKKGKLPGEIISMEYNLEYGTNVIEMHKDAIKAGQKVLIVDDLLATGGTVAATIEIVEQLGGEVVAVGFVIELEFLNGREDLKNYKVDSLIKF